MARELAGGREPELVWRNDLDGLVFRIGFNEIPGSAKATASTPGVAYLE